ncbi:MAG: glycine--tRNA ligase subunit beta [Burkholderiales bacterium]|nr:glycine--tRNA ligase subunit beta [Burkholderiales bacterium]
MTDTLLIELLTEELPPKALKQLSASFAALITGSLRNQNFLSASSEMIAWGTPRRLAVTIKHVANRSPDRTQTQKILPVNIAFDAAGKPTMPLMRKLASLGLTDDDISRLKRADDGKTEALFFDSVIVGKTLVAGVQEALDAAIAQLPIPKVMRYPRRGGYYSDVSFVRPAHRLLVLYGSDVLSVRALGLDANRITQGHRFLSATAEIEIDHAENYAALLERQGKVIASFEARRERIKRSLREASGNNHVVVPDALLDEVTSLVELPIVYRGAFDQAFLEVPQECLILTMQQNQKYFALTDADDKLVEYFLMVSNIDADQPDAIIKGNERVLRARLADARFFYQQDAQTPLIDRLDKLSHIVYFKGLGSQRDRVERIRLITNTLAEILGADARNAERIALLSKADLTTDMVGEFPELQGIMGRYYALRDGESDIVAAGVEQHYRPRFSGDALPTLMDAMSVAIADKIEAIFGMFAMGNVPTGDKDPFGLRRAAIGILRMMMERSLSLSMHDLIAAARAAFAPLSLAVADRKGETKAADLSSASVAIEDFFYDRLRGLLKDEGYPVSIIEAVLAQRPQDIASVPKRLYAVRAFNTLPESEALAAANKRIVNILKKADEAAQQTTVQPALFRAAAEKMLHDVFAAKLNDEVDAAMNHGDFTKALQVLASARGAIDQFFDEVMVMVDDPAVRNNRLALLSAIRRTMNRVAEIAMLAR